MGTPKAKQALIKAAGDELVAGNGFIEIKAVAQRAGVSVGLAYHHFGSKAGLIAAVVEDFWDALDADSLGVTFDGPDWGAGELERIRRYVRFHYDNPLSPLMLGRLGSEPEVMAVERARRDRHIALGTRNMARAQKQGQVPKELDPQLLTAQVLAGVRGGIEVALRRDKRPEFEQLVEEIWGFAAAAMRLESSAREAVHHDS